MISFTQLLENVEGPAVGTWVKLPTVDSVELLALAGFDFVVLDMEHAPLDIGTAHQLIGAATGRGVPALVRVASHEPATISRVLDSGAAGVFVPHVDTAKQAANVLSAARFPPHGTRGYGPTVRAGGWGVDAAGYRASGDRVAVIPQLESLTAIEAVKEISTISGLGALFVGPADLAVATGLAPDSREFADLLSTAEATAKEQQIPIGTAIGLDTRSFAELRDRYDFVLVGNDASMLGHTARSLVEAAKHC